MSLPHRFNTEPLSIPNKVPYLKIEPHLETRWKDRIGTQSFKIGIAWSGNPMHKNDHNRSINLSLFLPLLDAQATFVSLQTDIRPNDAGLKEQENILNLGEELKDFSDTAENYFKSGSGDFSRYQCRSPCGSFREANMGAVAVHPRLALAARPRG
jgi:hypothetical protein